MPNRADQLARLRADSFDVLVVGGGASGAGCALDAAGRGLRVGLVEAGDWASATSSKSTKLIHGGVRYLEQAVKKGDLAQLKQVRHGLRERRAMLDSAPFLARPLELVTPCATWVEAAYFFAGLKIYDWLAGLRNRLPSAKFLSKKKTLEKLPGLRSRSLHSAVAYFDGQFDDARYALLLVLSAVEKGAAAANYLKINGFEKGPTGKITAALAEDALTGERFSINAKQVLNCTGPASDALRLMANPSAAPRLRPSRGAHIVLPVSVLGNEKSALLIPKTRDGRLVFAIPSGGDLLVGTTDTQPEPGETAGIEPFLEKKEADFLLDTLNRFLQKPATVGQVKAGFAGLRPLVSGEKSRSTAALLRDHEVEFDEKSGLVSLLGGKWTTWRLMASDAVDFVCKRLEVNALCSTRGLRLPGAEVVGEDANNGQPSLNGLPDEVTTHLFQTYGSRASALAELATAEPSLSKRILENRPFISAEVVFHAREEMAVTVRDVLARRLRIEQHDWAAARAAAPVVAEVLADELGWDSAKRERELKSYVELLSKMGAAAHSSTD